MRYLFVIIRKNCCEACPFFRRSQKDMGFSAAPPHPPFLQFPVSNLPCREPPKRLTVAITKRGAIEDVLLALPQSQYRLGNLAATADGSPSWQQSAGRRRSWQGRAVSAARASCRPQSRIVFRTELSCDQRMAREAVQPYSVYRRAALVRCS